MKLRTYILLRCLLAVPTLIILVTIIFLIMRILPGDPIEMLIGEKLTPEALAAVRHAMGLDKSVAEQYVDMLMGIFRGNLGKAIWTQEPVMKLVMQALPASIELTVFGMAIGVSLGLLAGILSIFHRNKLLDHIIRIISFLLYSLPGFWLGMIMQIIFGVSLGWFPIVGHISPFTPVKWITGIYTLDAVLTGNISGLISALTYLVMPSLVLGAALFPITCRVTRASIEDTLTEQYIVTARAKGLLERAVILKHAFRNALLPIVTTVGMTFMDYIGGAVTIEYIFSWPGMGFLFIRSALDRDAPLLEGVILVYCLLVILISTGVDIVYSMVDPRVKLGE